MITLFRISIIRLYTNFILILWAAALAWPEIAAAKQDGSQESGARTGENPDRIKPYTNNPYYWQYKGEPVLLVGGSAQDNLFNHPAGLNPGDSLESHLELLVSVGGNYVRNTMSHRNEGNEYPFKRLADGRFDLTKSNEVYWRRFENFLQMTEQRDIIVQIEIWATYDYDGRGTNDGAPDRAGWMNHPFNPANNVNYSEDDTTLLAGFDAHPLDNPFFQTIPGSNDDPVVLAHQHAFVDRILSHTFKYSHVLYTMNNETWLEPDWAEYWINYIRARAGEAGRKVETTDMPSRPHGFRLLNQVHQPELYTFLEVSQNNRGPHGTQAGWDQLMTIRDRLAASPRPVNNTKIYGGISGGQSGTTEEGIQKFWRNFLAGCASIRFHRDPWGLGLTEEAQAGLRSVRMLTRKMNIFTAKPRNDLISEREPNEAYLLAEAGKQYALYFPGNGSVTLDLSDADGELELRWLNVRTGKWTGKQAMHSGKQTRISTPGGGHQVALILGKQPKS